MNCQSLKLKYEELLNLQNEFQIINAEFKKMKPKTVAERRLVSDELLRRQEGITKFIRENFESILWREQIIKRESEVIEKYFGFPVEVPSLPKEITKEKMEFWRENQFELHYSPGIDIMEDNNFKGQVNKIENIIYQWIKEGKINPEATKLPKGWFLFDIRPKPKFDNAMQMYENDILGSVIEKMRAEEKIQFTVFSGQKSSRFYVSFDDLNSLEVKKAFAEVLRVDQKQLDLPGVSLYNYCSNAFYPELVNFGTLEWLKDTLDNKGSLFCGSGNGSETSIGQTFFRQESPDRCYGNLGFRPVVYFS